MLFKKVGELCSSQSRSDKKVWKLLSNPYLLLDKKESSGCWGVLTEGLVTSV